jgi:hypothetical protein
MIIALSKEDYLATFVDPMRRLEAGESYKPIPLKIYIAECVSELSLPTTAEAIEIHHVYLSGDKNFSHILLSWGESNKYLVIVADHRSKTVLGHRILDLNEEYGLGKG